MAPRKTLFCVGLLVMAGLWNVLSLGRVVTPAVNDRKTESPTTTTIRTIVTETSAPKSTSVPFPDFLRQDLEAYIASQGNAIEHVYVALLSLTALKQELEHHRITFVSEFHPSTFTGNIGVAQLASDPDLLKRQSKKMAKISRDARRVAGVTTPEDEEVITLLRKGLRCRSGREATEVLTPITNGVIFDYVVVTWEDVQKWSARIPLKLLTKSLEALGTNIIMYVDPSLKTGAAEALQKSEWESTGSVYFIRNTMSATRQLNRQRLEECYGKWKKQNFAINCAENDIRIEKVIQLGSKTAIYKATVNGELVALKHFHYWHYLRFGGFLHLVGNSSVRSPLLNYPSGACIETSLENTVFQPQPLLRGLDLMKLKEKENDIGWNVRLSIALQLGCVFRHLHAHPSGPYTYDDIHPAQFFVKGVEDPTLLLVDLDTIQKTDDETHTSTCRCFYCNGGRAMCVFMNSPEGYRYCGQGGLQKDTTIRCTPKTDMWFLGQLLYHLLPNRRVPFSGYDEHELVEAVINGKQPKLDATKTSYNELIRDLWDVVKEKRPGPDDVIRRVQSMCNEVGCRISQCLDDNHNSVPYMGLT